MLNFGGVPYSWLLIAQMGIEPGDHLRPNQAFSSRRTHRVVDGVAQSGEPSGSSGKDGGEGE